jgi:molybdate transport system permease protein
VSGTAHKREDHPPIAGRRAHGLKIITLSFLALFVAVILVLVASDVTYLANKGVSWGRLWQILTSGEVLAAIRLSLITSLISLGLVIAFSVPIGYALSRYRFPGHAILNTIVDVPIVLPPVVIGLSLLAFFGTPVGDAIKAGLKTANWSMVSGIGIVLCQFLVSVSYSIRACKASFDLVDRRLEHVALCLGCSQMKAFWRVSLPLARNGLIAGSIMAWARAIGVFGPLMVFVGTGPRVQVMPTSMWLELSIGNIEVSLAIALVALTMAGVALAVVHVLAPGRTWT